MTIVNTVPTAGQSARIVQSLLFLLGALLVAYAVSDHPLYGGEPGFGHTQWLITGAGIGLATAAFLPFRHAGIVLLVAFTFLLMLAVAEIAAERTLGTRLRPVFQQDNRLIFKFIPNRSSTMTRSSVNGSETVTHHINAQGFRGDALIAAGHVPRIVVFGDSFIHAFYTSDRETFAQRLGQALASPLGKPVEIINAGVSSYGPDQIALKMAAELPILRPDVAVVAIFAGNDYGDLMRNKLYRLAPDGTLVENHWTLDPQLRIWFDLSQRESILKRALRNVSVTLRHALGGSNPVGATELTDMTFLLKEAEHEYRNFIAENDNTVTNTHIDYYSADLSLAPKSASARYKVALMEAVIGRIRDVAQKNRVPLVLLFIPHPVDVTDAYDGWQIDRKRYPDYDGRNQIAPLERIAGALNIPFVSLYDIYRSRDANALYFHGGDDHWNANGQRVAAEEMARYMLARELLSATGKPTLGISAGRNGKTAN